MVLSAAFFTLSVGIQTVSAANWAQVSGIQQQNVIQSSVDGWSPRWGLAVAAYDPPIVPPEGSDSFPEGTNIDQVESRNNVIFVLGGDDYNENTRKGGYHNDVWRSEGQVYEPLVNKVTQESKVVSRAKWRLIWGDKIPPIGATYDEWLECFTRKWRGVPTCRESDDPYTGDLRRWSPRRNHAAINFLPAQATNNLLRGFNGIWVLGGRARAIDDIPVKESWGGVYPMDGGDYSIEELKYMFHQAQKGYDSVTMSSNSEASAPLNGFTNSGSQGSKKRLYGARYKLGRWREKSVLKNDVWTTEDGIVWHLVNPGCKYHEEGRPDYEATPGTISSICGSDNDCYGDSSCRSELTGRDVIPGQEKGRCVCNMWTPRERHAVAVFNDQLIVSGGLTRVEYQRCGEHPCGGGYRHWVDDVWASFDGEHWEQLSGAGSRGGFQAYPPRGEHALIVMHNMMFVLGGRGQRINKSYLVGEDEYLNDVWQSTNGRVWQQVQYSSPWSPRSNFAAGVVPNGNGAGDKLVIYGGQNGKESHQGLLDEAWWSDMIVTYHATQPPTVGSDHNSTAGNTSDIFIDPLASIGTLNWFLDYSENPGPGFRYDPINYVMPDSPVSLVANFTVEELELLEDFKIKTILELATLGQEAVVSSRNSGLRNICYYKMRAIAAVNKCTVKPIIYDGYFDVYQHVKLSGQMSNPYKGLRGVTGEGASRSSAVIPASAPILNTAVDQELDLPYGTDGCQQPDDEDEHLDELNDIDAWRADAEVGNIPEIICKWNPRRRTEHASIVFRNKMYIFGGKALEYTSTDRSIQSQLISPRFDVWYRDETQPIGEIVDKPRDYSSDTIFTFKCNELNCLYEVQLLKYDCADIDPLCEGTTIFVPWTISTSEADFQDVLVSGRYVLQLRTYDPAGNIDIALFEGGNQYTWVYTAPLPVAAITLTALILAAIAVGVFIELRRRRKKQAMERYALKRMRRKFKGMAKDANKKDAKLKRKRAGGGKKKKSNKVSPDPSGSKPKKKKKAKPSSPKKKK